MIWEKYDDYPDHMKVIHILNMVDAQLPLKNHRAFMAYAKWSETSSFIELDKRLLETYAGLGLRGILQMVADAEPPLIPSLKPYPRFNTSDNIELPDIIIDDTFTPGSLTPTVLGDHTVMICGAILNFNDVFAACKSFDKKIRYRHYTEDAVRGTLIEVIKEDRGREPRPFLSQALTEE